QRLGGEHGAAPAGDEDFRLRQQRLRLGRGEGLQRLRREDFAARGEPAQRLGVEDVPGALRIEGEGELGRHQKRSGTRMALTVSPARANSASSAASSGAAGGWASAASASGPAGSAMAAVISTVVPAGMAPRNCGTMVLLTTRLVLGRARNARPARRPERSRMALRSVALRATPRPVSSL